MKLRLIGCLLCFSSVALASPTHGTFLALRELQPKQGVMYEIELKGGEYTSVDVNGTNAGGDLDCVLYKSVDVVAEDKGRKVDNCHMKVGVPTTDKYTLVIVNNGSSVDRLTMMVQ